MITWNMNSGRGPGDGPIMSPNEARDWLTRVLDDRDLAGEYWDQLVHVSDALGVRPTLPMVAYLNHLDELQADAEVWAAVPASLRRWLTLFDGSDDIESITDAVIGAVMSRYDETWQPEGV